MLDVTGLRVFIAIAEHRHFVRAADALGIVQSVASKRLRRLEDQLGVRLVDRDKRSTVALTRAGGLFLGEARDTIARIEQAERIGRNIGRGTAGPLRIGYVFSAVMVGLVSRIIRGLQAQLPALEVIPSLMETPEQMVAIAEGRIDLGLARPRPSYPAGVQARHLHSESLIVAMSSDHPLASTGALSARDLHAQRFIVPQFHEQVGLIDSIHALADAGDFATPDIVRTSDFITAASLAAAGTGVVLAPNSLRRLHLEGLCYRDVEDFGAAIDLMLMYRADTPLAAMEIALSALGV